MSNKISKIRLKGTDYELRVPEYEKRLNELPQYTTDCLNFTLNAAGTGYEVSYKEGSTEVIIPPYHEGLPVTTISDNAFYDCTSLTSVTIPDSVTNIGYGAFNNCTNLTSVIIGDSVTSIGSSAFEYCTSLKSIIIGNSVTSIGDYAFYCCTGLTNVTIPDSVTSIGYCAFSDCFSLKSIMIPNNVESIGAEAFAYCSGLRRLAIPGSVTEIGAYAFRDCTSLIRVTISNGVTSIGTGAFYGSTPLAGIELPSSVTNIGNEAFFGIAPDAHIYCEASAKPSGWSNNWYDESTAAVVHWGAKLDIPAINDAIKISGTVTKDIGGIAKNTIYTEADLTEVLTDLLFPYVAPTITSFTLHKADGTQIATGVHELGEAITVSKVAPRFTVGSKAITGIKVGTSKGGSDLCSKTGATSGAAISLTTSKTFNGSTGGTIYCTLEDGDQGASAQATISYASFNYVIASPSMPTSRGSGKNLKQSLEVSELTTADGDYIWFLLPTSKANPQIQQFALSQWNNMNTTSAGTVSFTTDAGRVATYYVYRTDKMKSATGHYQII